MAVVNLIHKRIEEYVAEVLNDKRYFFFSAHEKKMLKPLLEDGISSDIKDLVSHVGVDESIKDYIDRYLDHSDRFATFNVERGTQGKGKYFRDVVITLPERKEEVRRLLEKLHFYITE